MYKFFCDAQSKIGALTSRWELIKFGIPDWPSVEQAPRVEAFLSAAQNPQAAKKVQNIAKNDCKKP